MIICTNCGNHNEDSDEFCGSCGKFLEWVGERVEAPVVAVEATVEPEVEAKVGLIDRVKAAVGVEGGTGLPTEPTGPTPEELELEAAAAAAAAQADADDARLQAEAAVAAERAAKSAEEARQRAED
ncbi:MAG: zinc ribbon domain-containing protein, partial [Actinomycetota bacterium]|nr:zinc ribbon domain-containing protein [Actinomycetota bacterium]